MGRGVILELLDPDEHECIHAWELAGDGEITLGRSPASDVVVRNRFVSRKHARLEPSEGGWLLSADSEQGVFVDGQRRERISLELGKVFRLGAGGPSLRLVEPTRTSPDESETTVRFRPSDLEMLSLDTRQRDDEVDEIARSDFFRDLKQRMDKLRSPAGGAVSRSGPDPEDEGGRRR